MNQVAKQRDELEAKNKELYELQQQMLTVPKHERKELKERIRALDTQIAEAKDHLEQLRAIVSDPRKERRDNTESSDVIDDSSDEVVLGEHSTKHHQSNDDRDGLQLSLSI